MLIFDEQGFKMIATKTNKPKIKAGDWDSVYIRIDEEKYNFYCSNKGNRSNFYFKLNDEWYRLPMYDSNVGDLYTRRPDLFTKKPMHYLNR